LAEGEDGREITAEPVQVREGRGLNNKELAFFRDYGELRQVLAGSARATSLDAQRAQMLADMVSYLMRRNRERKHIMCTKALQGTITFSKNGISINESIGIDTITAPASFATAGTKTVEEFYRFFDEFENGDGSGVTGANVAC